MQAQHTGPSPYHNRFSLLVVLFCFSPPLVHACGSGANGDGTAERREWLVGTYVAGKALRHVCGAHRRAAPVSKLTVKSYSMVGMMDEMNLRNSSIDKSARVSMCCACVRETKCACVCVFVRVRAGIVCAVGCMCVDPIQDQNPHVCRPPHTPQLTPPQPPLPPTHHGQGTEWRRWRTRAVRLVLAPTPHAAHHAQQRYPVPELPRTPRAPGSNTTNTTCTSNQHHQHLGSPQPEQHRSYQGAFQGHRHSPSGQ